MIDHNLRFKDLVNNKATKKIHSPNRSVTGLEWGGYDGFLKMTGGSKKGFAA
jgi:hypothetical protein